tara:strand:- start:2817 stop:3869 length:1053 start_codon:yes stop_codon:yes gene_type:complete
MGQKPHERAKALRNNMQRQKNKEMAAARRKSISEQQAIERLGLRNLSPTSKKRVIQGKAPRRYRGSYENYVANMHKAYLEKTEAAEKIQAAFRNPDQFRKKVRKMKKLNQLEKKALKLAQRRNLLQEEDRIRGELNAMSPNIPSPPRGRMNHKKKIRLYNNNPVYRKKMLELWNRANPKPRGFGARASRKITQLYTNGRAKSIRDKKRLYKKKMMKIATEKPPKRKRPRQAQKPRKKKKPTRTTNSPTIAQIQRNLLAANSPTIAQIQRNLLANSSPRRRKRSRVLPKPNAATAKNARRARIEKRRGLVQIKKRYTLTDLVTGKIKTFTKKGWYDRAVAKQQSLRMRICA